MAVIVAVVLVMTMAVLTSTVTLGGRWGASIMVLLGVVGMQVGTDIPKRTAVGDVLARLLLIKVGVVQNFLFRMCEFAVVALHTFIDEKSNSSVVPILVTLAGARINRRTGIQGEGDLHYRRTQDGLVVVCLRVSTQPSIVDFNMSEATQFVIVIVPFCTPATTELGQLLLIHVTKHVGDRSFARAWTALSSRQRQRRFLSGSPPSGGCTGGILSEEQSPFLSGQLKSRSVRCVTDELVVAAEDVFGRTDVLVEAQQYSAL